MISAQCDELRRLASTLDTRYRYADDIATALCEAADTIWDLRNRCADLMDKRDVWAENDAKLRELVRDMWRFTGTACKKYPRLFDPPAQGPQMVQLNALESFEQRMRELGIEVD